MPTADSEPKVLGTPYYMAPEIITDKKFDYKSDLWSIGCILYLMLAGVPPFNGLDDAEVIAKIIRGKYQENTVKLKGAS